MLYLSISVFCKVSSGPNFNKMIQQSKAKHPSSNDLQTNNIVTIMDATPKKKVLVVSLFILMCSLKLGRSNCGVSCTCEFGFQLMFNISNYLKSVLYQKF